MEELENQIVAQYQTGGGDGAGGAMTDAHVAIVMLCLFITAIFLGFPIAFTLLALAFIFGWYAMGERVVSLIATNSADVMTNDTLVAVPLFLFMGYLVERSNIRTACSIQVAAWACRPRSPSRPWSPARCSPPPRGSSARS